jgi:2-aminophenol/2-amino-5-chlorophenol 1,6-dioxygenase alpha subunit
MSGPEVNAPEMSAKDICVVAGALVPGLPHLLTPATPQKPLAEAMRALGEQWRKDGVERIVWWSTQWIAVLGQMFQARADLQGSHVDENWHELGKFNFRFRIDTSLAARMAQATRAAGMQAQLVDYDAFPVDTGTIVADQLINPGAQFSSAIVACNVYTDHAGTDRLGTIVRDSLSDGIPTAIVAVSSLSGRWFTHDINLAEDRVSSPEDESWNERMLALLTAGDLAGFWQLCPEWSRTCKVDMGMKAFAFLSGVLGLDSDQFLGGRSGFPLKRPFVARVLATGPVWGTGAAVVQWKG